MNPGKTYLPAASMISAPGGAGEIGADAGDGFVFAENVGDLAFGGVMSCRS